MTSTTEILACLAVGITIGLVDCVLDRVLMLDNRERLSVWGVAAIILLALACPGCASVPVSPNA